MYVCMYVREGDDDGQGRWCYRRRKKLKREKKIDSEMLTWFGGSGGEGRAFLRKKEK